MIPAGGLVVADIGDPANIFDALAYDAPFPDDSYKAGVRRFLSSSPSSPTWMASSS